MATPQKAPKRKSIAFFGAEGICELNGRFPNAPSFEKQPAKHGGVLCPANARRPFAPAMEASPVHITIPSPLKVAGTQDSGASSVHSVWGLSRLDLPFLAIWPPSFGESECLEKKPSGTKVHL